MFIKKASLLIAFAALFVAGCAGGAVDSGPTNAGSGAPAPNSGAAGSTSAPGTGGGGSGSGAGTSR